MLYNYQDRLMVDVIRSRPMVIMIDLVNLMVFMIGLLLNGYRIALVS